MASKETERKFSIFVQKIKDPKVRDACAKLVSSPLPENAPALPAITFRLEATRTANNPHANTLVVDETILRMAPYLLKNEMQKCTISLDPFVAFPLAVFLEQQGVNIKREKTMSAPPTGSAVMKLPSGDLQHLQSLAPAELLVAVAGAAMKSKL